MERLVNFNEAQQVLKEYSLGGTITNNYFLPATMKQMINDGKLFYSKSSENLFFFEDRGEFYQLYYHLNNIYNSISLVHSKPVIMEILYRGKQNIPFELLNYWGKCGFHQHIVRENMTAINENLILPQKEVIKITIKIADSIQEAIFVHKLIEDTFDKFTGDILSLDETIAFVNQNYIICAYYENKLSGFLQFEIKNNVHWIGHIAISVEFRGKGIAMELVKSFILMHATKANTRFQLWVMQENKSAIELYRKFGFIYGNKSSVSMLKV